MILDRVTMTGADDSVNPEHMLVISEQFPFVEWGILISASQQSSPRFPSPKWIKDLQGIAGRTGGMDLSLHVCGQWVRALLMGNMIIPPVFFDCFRRVQLNFHAERCLCTPTRFAKALKTLKGKQIIFQLDGANGNEYMDDAMAEGVADCVGLFDVSGGAGIVPKEWPKPFYLNVIPGPHGEGIESFAYHGFAGGLGPESLEIELPRIAEAAGDCRIWIDMETRIRSSNDRQFDLNKVRECLEICQPFVNTKQAAI